MASQTSSKLTLIVKEEILYQLANFKILTAACDVAFAADCSPCSKFSAIKKANLVRCGIQNAPHGKQNEDATN